MTRLDFLNLIKSIPFIWFADKTRVRITKTEKCLAMSSPQFKQDLTNLGVKTWYVWGSSLHGESGNIPMSYHGDDPKIPAPQYMLVFNEPESPAPYGCNLEPAEAVQKFKALEMLYPSTIFIVGNSQSVDWLLEFKSHYGRFRDIWGVHIYQPDATKGKSVVDDFLSRLGRTETWLTECGLLKKKASTTEFETFIGYALKKFKKIFVYTNRNTCSAFNYDVDLCNDAGLTAIGEVYKKL